jgi:type IV pilus biogenesis protein CpaD/CtpE
MQPTKARLRESTELPILAVLAAVAAALTSCNTLVAIEALPDDFASNVWSLLVGIVEDVVSVVTWAIAL